MGSYWTSVAAVSNLLHELFFFLQMLTMFHVLVGVDVRKAMADGFPLKNVVTIDLKNGK